ncbi:hypothetical protein [Lentzea flava]|uniref:Uncharacterized protein n=1 Tax=Lentzea flava TaxID=103732 RepID=A0ABQ2VAZ7_9PSEU|nr:hypothetical protein [Lentzea flava]MCP2204343.1 hypothetical protein [Lentzea flava]GGU76811.1 hypothetical protein GCM10010178_80060 [Lentzea flava]
MSASFEEVLCGLRDLMLSHGDEEGAEQCTSLITATVAADELVAAIRRGDGEAMSFHHELLVRSTAEASPLRFMIKD